MKSIEVISIPVADQQLSKQFYMKLGFEIIHENPMGNGQDWVQLGLPGQATSISLVNWWPHPDLGMKAGSLKGLILLTEDMEKEVAELKAKGILENPIGMDGNPSTIMNTPWGKFYHFTDIDGNGIDLHESNM